MSEEEVTAALEKLRARRRREQDQTDDPQLAGTFEPPTAQLEQILEQIRVTSKRFNILPPPPFLPDIKIPASREENNGVLERLPRIAEPPPKPEPQKPQINCPRCHSPSPVGTRYCSVCAWDLNMQYTVDRGFQLRR